MQFNQPYPIHKYPSQPTNANVVNLLTYQSSSSTAAPFESLQSLSCRHVLIELLAFHGVFLLLLELQSLEHLWVLYAPLSHQLLSLVFFGFFTGLIR